MNFEGINWDDDMVTFCIDNLKNVDSILLGRVTAEGFIPYWKELAGKPVSDDDINSRIAKPINDTHKEVFSNSLAINPWDNAAIISGEFATEIRKLKEKTGKDIIVYGGNTLVSTLVEHRLVDEFFFLVNPLAISTDEPILKFIKTSLPLTLKECKPFPCGTILLHYSNRK